MYHLTLEKDGETIHVEIAETDIEEQGNKNPLLGFMFKEYRRNNRLLKPNV